MLKRKRKLSGLTIWVLVFSMLFSSFNPIWAYANSDDENLIINAMPSPKIDIALSVGSTIINLESFADDLKRELEARGISYDQVKFQEVETIAVSTDDADAKRIFQEWANFPFNGPSYWFYDEENKWITTTYNEAYETGFIDMTHGTLRDFNLEALVQGPDMIQPLGFVFRAYPQTSDPRYWNMYYLWVSYDQETQDKVLTLFKVKNQNLDFSNRNSPSHYSATPLRRYEGNKFGWPNHQPYDYGGFPHGTPYQRGITVKNLYDPLTETTILDFAEVKGYDMEDWYRLRLEVTGNKFVVYLDGVKMMEYIDQNNPYMSGYYGIFSYSHVNPKFKSVTSEIKNYKKFGEVIRQPEWREGSYRFIVHAEDYAVPEFNDAQSSGEILTRLINEEIAYVALGTNENKQQMLNFISRNNGKGTFIDNRNYNQAIRQLADYIANEVRSERNIEGDSQYILLGESLDIEVHPSHLKTNTQTAEYPQGRWRVDHDFNYFQNNLGQYAKSGQYVPDLDFVFDKPGKYELWFADKHPSPRYIYVHRRPVADYSVQVTKNGNNYNVSVTDKSYDLDHQYEPDKGIVAYEWKWRETTSNTWNNGLPSMLASGKEYILQLRVKDREGFWSMPESRYISTSNALVKPVASFEMPSQATRYQTVPVSDSSYDPAGRTITKKEWIVKKNGVEIYRGQTPMTNFNAYGEGTYEVALKVQNDAGLWSEEFKRFIVITGDNIKPDVIFDKTHQDWINEDVVVTMTFYDEGGSGLHVQRYAVTNSPVFPVEGWSEWSTDPVRVVTLTEEGRWYIHVEAKDNDGNVLQRTMGEYRIDKTPPALPVIVADKMEPTNRDVIVSIAYPDDATVKEYKVDDGAWIQYTAPVVMEQDGIVYARAIDEAGNVSMSEFVVANIDKTPPTAPQIVVNVDTVTVVPGEDDRNGVLDTLIRVNGGEWTSYHAPVKLQDGEYTVEAKSIDGVGNESYTFVHFYVYINTLKKAEQLVRTAEAYPTETKINQAREAVLLLPDVAPEKQELLERLDNLELQLKVNEAVKKVELAEKFQREPYISNAYESVNALPEGEIKQELLDRLQAIIDKLEKERQEKERQEQEKQLNKLIEKATKKVEQAEKYKREPYLKNAYDAVNALPECEEKEALKSRLDAIQKELERMELDKLIAEATKKVELAEKMRREAYIRQAEEAVNKLPECEEKDALKARLDALKRMLEDEMMDKLYEDAVKKVELAEKYQKEPYISNAYDAVYKLPEGELRNTLEDRLDALIVGDGKDAIYQEWKRIKDLEAKMLFLDIIKAVERAEKYFSRANIVYAMEKIALVSDDLKAEYEALFEALNARVDALKETYNAVIADKQLEQLIKKAETAVESYERFRTAALKEKAQQAVDALTEPNIKERLQQRIDAVELKN